MLSIRHLRPTQKRIVQHILFWLGYYAYRVLNYGGYVNTYENVMYVQALELPVKILSVYITLYWLLPILLKHKKSLLFGISIVLLILVSTLIQLQMIRLMASLGIYDIRVEEVFTFRRFMSAQWHIISIVFITAAIKILKNAYQVQQDHQALVQDKLETELKLLKAQINPHFLFNTLNSLYALSLQKSELTSAMLLKLSDLMHYMLYDAASRRVALTKELEYLESYIALEKIRYGDELNILFEIDGNLAGINIPPMLFIPLVENSFKHGPGSSKEEGFIRVQLSVNQSVIELKVENSLINSYRESSSEGFGLKNLKRRLELLYKDRYDLSLTRESNLFRAKLQLKID